MGRPRMTEEQRAVAVALLANAIRKDEHLRAQEADRAGADLVPVLAAGRRAEASRQYLNGMRDLLGVLFDGGRTVADECYDVARTQALSTQAQR